MEASNKIELFEDFWQEIYASRQNNSIIYWPATGVEDFSDGKSEGKMPCLVVSKGRIKGIVPLTETGVAPAETKLLTRHRLMTLVGQEVAVIVRGINTEEGIFVASRKDALEKLQATMWPKLTEGAVVEAVAQRVVRRLRQDSSLRETGVVVDIGGVEGFLPIQEITYGWVDEILDRIQPGDKFDAKVLVADREKNKLIVSTKALIPNPWPEAAKRFCRGGGYDSIVTGVVPYGIFTRLEDGVDALCKHLKSGSVKKGDRVITQVIAVDPEKQQIRGVIARVIRRK